MNAQIINDALDVYAQTRTPVKDILAEFGLNSNTFYAALGKTNIRLRIRSPFYAKRYDAETTRVIRRMFFDGTAQRILALIFDLPMADIKAITRRQRDVTHPKYLRVPRKPFVVKTMPRTPDELRLMKGVRWQQIWKLMGKSIGDINKRQVWEAAKGSGPLVSWAMDAALCRLICDVEPQGLQTDLEDFTGPPPGRGNGLHRSSTD